MYPSYVSDTTEFNDFLPYLTTKCLFFLSTLEVNQFTYAGYKQLVIKITLRLDNNDLVTLQL